MPRLTERHLSWGLSLLALLLALARVASGAPFQTATLRCVRTAQAPRCTLSEAMFGYERRTSVIADVRAARYGDSLAATHPADERRAGPRVLLSAAGGEVPLPGSFGFTDSQELTAWLGAGEPRQLTLSSAHWAARVELALLLVAALLLLLRRKQPTDHRAPADLSGAAWPRSLWQRHLLGALALRRSTYRELADDPRALRPAVWVVLVVALVVSGLRGLRGDLPTFDDVQSQAGHAGALLAAVAGAASALVGWLSAGVVTSWFAAGRGGVRTWPLLRALGFTHLMLLVGLVPGLSAFAWPLCFVASWQVTRSVCTAGRLRAGFATMAGQSFGLLLSAALWLSLLNLD